MAEGVQEIPVRPWCLASVGALLSAIAAASVAPQCAMGPAQPHGTFTAPRTRWGDPDLEGIWDSKTITPLQRPGKFGGREFLTADEAASVEKEAAEHPGQAERAEAAEEALAQGVAPFVEDAVGSCLLTFTYPGSKVVRTKRTSLIVDPQDGRIPVLGQGRAATVAPPVTPARGNPRVSHTLDNSGRADDPEDRPAIERCLGVSLPCLGALCAFTRMVQSPGYITIYYEQGTGGGAYRTIPLDGRPHLPSGIRLWLGDSVGHWEGKTLLIDTTNFTNQTSFRGSREHLHLVERFTRIRADEIIYRVTTDDVTTFAKPWTLEMTLTKVDDRPNLIYESACHEGNYSMTSTLAGARVLENDAAAQKKRPK